MISTYDLHHINMQDHTNHFPKIYGFGNNEGGSENDVTDFEGGARAEAGQDCPN